MEFCKDCSKLWTKYCPFRTRNILTDRKKTDSPCSEFMLNRKDFVWKSRNTKIYQIPPIPEQG